MRPRLAALVLATLCTPSAGLRAADDLDFFEKKVRPLLVQHCHSCHSAAGKQKGGLRLDGRSAILRGGDSGPAIVPGHPEQSRLVTAIGYGNVDLQMPPKGKLPDAAIADLTEWVRRGAPWPQEDGPKAVAATFDLARRKAEHWAWRPVRPTALPDVRDDRWPLSPIDRFILAKLEVKNLTPAPPADQRTLIRRASFDLTGLPPTPDEINTFLADDSAGAFAKVVDRLLASPHFGERWGRHWLDLVRYAETRGHEFDYPSPNAYQYRDYVIRALNADVPYDQFVAEHLAGDLLEHPRRHPTEGFNESILGTGFWFLGEQIHSPVDLRQDEADRLDNMLDVMTKTFLGLTVSCARCHDHKFDAVSTKDYYALLGFLESGSYRLARFDTHDEHRLIAAELRTLRERHRPALQRAVAEALRPGAKRMAESLTAPKGAWAAALKTAADDPLDPLHVWTTAAGDPQHWPERVRSSLDALARPEPADHFESVVVDCGRLHAGDWLPDDAGFSAVRPGDARFGTDPARPLLGVFDRPAAAFDPAWDGIKPAPGSEEDPGDLGKMHRPGRTLRTPSFTISADKLYSLVRGRGHAFASVNSHVMMEGPLHRKLVQPVAAKDGFRWVEHDLSRYRGQRAHVEFSAARGGDFAVAMVVQANKPPGPIGRANPLLLRALADGAASPEALAVAYQRLFVRVLDALADDRILDAPDAADLARLADWILRHSDLFPANDISDVARPFIVEQTALLSGVRPVSRLAPAALDGSGVDEHVFIRGNPKTPGEPAPRRFLEALVGPAPLNPPRGSGRLELARQVTDPVLDPFLARVMVNRAWHHLFGRGIVASTDNFGALGEPPAHPELLDFLADRFVRDGWSLKTLLRSLMLTRTYQMASRPQGPAEEADPQNLLLHRMNLRRLEGEAIRDAMLSVSGRIDTAMFGPPVPTHVTAFQDGRGKPTANGPLDGAGRRSVYLAVRRNFLPPFLLAFDTPAPATTAGRRTVSNVPAQALILLNDPFVHQQAALWAKHVLDQPGLSAAERIDGMYVRATARPPRAEERADCLAFLSQQAEARGVSPDDPAVWADLAHVLFNLKEFIFLY